MCRKIITKLSTSKAKHACRCTQLDSCRVFPVKESNESAKSKLQGEVWGEIFWGGILMFGMHGRSLLFVCLSGIILCKHYFFMCIQLQVHRRVTHYHNRTRQAHPAKESHSVQPPNQTVSVEQCCDVTGRNFSVVIESVGTIMSGRECGFTLGNWC